MKKLKHFKIIRCKNCGKSSLTTSNKIFKCKYCNTSELIFKKKTWGVAVNLLFDLDDRKEALAKIRVTKDVIEGKSVLTKLGFYDRK